MRRTLKLLLSCSLLAWAVLEPPLQPAAAQNDCGPNLRCGQVPWQLPVMPVLVSPTPLATSAVVNAAPTQASAYIQPTPIWCVAPSAQDTDYKQVVANTGPAGYWPLDETTGSAAVDASGNSITGIYTGATLDATTLAGGPAPSFDGVNDRVAMSPLLSVMNAQQFTVALWMKVSSWSGSGTLAHFSGGSTFALTRSGGSLVLTSGGAQASASASGNGTNWVHVAAVISRPVLGGQSGTLYINGQSAAAANTAPGTFSGTNVLYVGSTAVGSFFAGNIGHVAVWNRALSAGEIALLANAAPAAVYTPTPDPNCAGYITPTPPMDFSQLADTMATLQQLPANQVGIENPQAGFDMYAGTATFFSYVLGIQNVNLGVFTPILAFAFWSFFSFVGIKVAFLLLPIIAALFGVIRRIVQLVLDFLPF